MQPIVFILIAVFVTINIIQTWLIFNYPSRGKGEKRGFILFDHKLLTKGAVIIGGMEAIEFPIVIYLIIKGGVVGFLTVVLVEIIQWSLIAYLSTNSKIK